MAARTGSQDAVISFLGSAKGHPGGGPVEVIETHGALIFLAGDVALKLKRAVRYDYMDLSTPARRHRMLLRELALNQPVAPKIYDKVLPVTRAPEGALSLDGPGEPVDWVLRMWRFPAEAELSVIADTRGIGDALADDLGRSILAYHARAPLRQMDGPALIGDILDELARVFADMERPLGQARTNAFLTAARAALHRIARLLHDRAEQGHVRRCHGDLHLRNLVLLEGRPVPFDALEFDETLGTCDVLYDLAFLLMDMRHRGLGRAANITLNAYLLAAGGTEDAGLAALPLFLSVRAAIRAMVLVQTAQATGRDADPDAVAFLDDAIGLLAAMPQSLVLIGGLSGTGKTTIARALAPRIGPAPGAVHLRSDLERKGAADFDRDYSPNARAAVYDRVFARAATILGAGRSVLIDATFLNPDHRAQAQAVAKAAAVPLQALWLDAPLPVLKARVAARTGDASDADATVIEAQVAADSAPKTWPTLQAEGDLATTIRQAGIMLDLPPTE